jgi:hypothetical protein
MSANPALMPIHDALHGSILFPAPFQGESFLASRQGMQFDIESVLTTSKKWSAKGTMFLSNVRMVFVADAPDPVSGLAAFDLPLVYIRNDSLKQPIFGCNNLTGECWPAVEGGGPAGNLAPHAFSLYFLQGGIGTFYPLYYLLVEKARDAFSRSAAQRAMEGEEGSGWREEMRDPLPAPLAESLASRAYVDPNDPSKIYLTQPTEGSERINRPRYEEKYAATYGEDEQYEDLDPAQRRGH